MNFPNRIPREPRERFIRYYHDLHHLEKSQFSKLDVFTFTLQYTYAELGEAILDKCKNDNILKNLDLLIVCYWTHEFDPDYSCGAYFSDKYRLKGTSFDICDQGIMSPITALKIMQCYMKHSIKNALLLCFDQSAIPLCNDYQGVKPGKASSMGIYFQNTDPEECFIEINQVGFDDYKNTDEEYKISVNSELKKEEINCAEIFKPLLIKSNFLFNKKKKFLLKISDIESNQLGYIRGKILNGRYQ